MASEEQFSLDGDESSWGVIKAPAHVYEVEVLSDGAEDVERSGEGTVDAPWLGRVAGAAVLAARDDELGVKDVFELRLDAGGACAVAPGEAVGVLARHPPDEVAAAAR